MPSTLRTRFGQAAAAFVVVGLLLHWIGGHLAYSAAQTQSDLPSALSDNITLGSVFSALGNGCVSVAVVLVAGIVASMVIEEAMERRLWMDADLDDDSEAGEESDG